MRHETMTWDDRVRRTSGTSSRTARQAWGEMTDRELEEVRGTWEQFLGTIQQKTGETPDTIERKLQRATA